jgi:nucleotide-binding universal stress UspA family protein
MSEESLADYITAANHFFDARRKADWELLLARLRGTSAELLPYEEVRRMLQASASSERGLRDIPLAAIVGSVGRYTEFTRNFLPRQDDDKNRWTRVKVAMEESHGLPPIEVYQIGQVYFVKDGNHRVSIAREMGATTIQAYVTEVHSKASLTPDVRPDDLILKAEYVEFLNHTHLDVLHPEAMLTVTAPGMYATLEAHIQMHRYYMGVDLQHDIGETEAITHWYDTVYLPVSDIIHRLDLLAAFPGRTETDLYLWLAEHRESLRESLGWDIPTATAAADLADHFSPRPARVITRVGEKLLETLTPAPLLSGPRPGTWRATRQGADCLFHHILVALNGQESGWVALDQALEFARREDGHLYGLHVVPSEAHKETRAVLDLEETFKARCIAADVPGELAFEIGDITAAIITRARWADLLVVSLDYPPGPGPLAKLQSGFRELIQRTPIPVLAVSRPIFPVNHLLLAYDASSKSQEALFVTAYLAARWNAHVTVLTVNPDIASGRQILEKARDILREHGIQADGVGETSAPVGAAIAIQAETVQADLVVMGGYAHSAMLEVVFDSTVNAVLRAGWRAVLLCR